MPSAFTPRRAPVTLVALTLLACTGLTACSSNDPPTEVVVTVTGAPTPAASAAPRPSAPPEPQAAMPDSEVEGRTFDFGLVTGARTVGATDVLVVDRWTDPRVPDETLAEHGLEVGPWDLGSDRYVNQNSEVTFDIPVREGTTFLLHHCVAKGEPVQTRSAGAAALGAAPASDRLLLVEIDDEGWATGGETLAGC